MKLTAFALAVAQLPITPSFAAFQPTSAPITIAWQLQNAPAPNCFKTASTAKEATQTVSSSAFSTTRINTLKTRPAFDYCQDHKTKAIYIKGNHRLLANIDIDCDGDLANHGDGHCGKSHDTQGATAFKDTVRAYSKESGIISDINGSLHPYVVFGNEGNYSEVIQMATTAREWSAKRAFLLQQLALAMALMVIVDTIRMMCCILHFQAVSVGQFLTMQRGQPRAWRSLPLPVVTWEISSLVGFPGLCVRRT